MYGATEEIVSTALEPRVSELEKAVKEIAYAQLRAERSLEELAEELKSFKDEMSGFKDEMSAFKDEMRDFKSEMQASRRQLDKKWGELANRLGTVVEDIVAPNISGVLSRHFGVDEPDIVMVRTRRRHPQSRNRRREFDVVAITADALFLNETKSTMRSSYIDEFAENYGEVTEYFPEFADRRVVPIMSSLQLPPEMVDALTERGIYAMAMADDTMDLLNFEALKARE